MYVWLRYLIALVIGFHGLVYLISPFWVTFQEWKGVSLLLGGTVSTQSLKAISTGLWVVAGISLLGAALTIALAPLVPGWWRPIAIMGGLAGAVSFAVFWDGQMQQFTNQGGVGMIISLVIVGSAVAFAHAFG
ncbi:MAG: hypothetical protein M1368_06020 [Thaumarchaeota archaeon]|nr:hypothetical protein [Nitrososphaerota archaeon]